MKKFATFFFVAFVTLAAPTISFLPAQNRPPVHWVSGGESIVVKQGESYDFQAQFYSDLAVTGAASVMKGKILSLVSPEPANGGGVLSQIGDVEPNRIYSIRYHLQVPQNLPLGEYPGILTVVNWKRYDTAGTQVFPENLRVKIYVLDANP